MWASGAPVIAKIPTFKTWLHLYHRCSNTPHEVLVGSSGTELSGKTPSSAVLRIESFERLIESIEQT